MPEPSPPKPPKPYQRPTLPFERPATLWVRAGQWSAIGIEFGLAVVLFFLGGRALDANLGTSPWLAVTGAMVGVAAGTYLLVRPLLRGSTDGPSERPPAPPSPPGSPEGQDPER